MRKFFLKVHLYSGLICFWYLIVLGTSSLNFNHHFSFMQNAGETQTWARGVNIADTFQDDLALSQTIRDSLRLIGWPLPWETYHDSTGVFHFTLQQPGKRYAVAFSFTDGIAHVQATSKGFWTIFNSLHGAGGVPNSVFMDIWKWYTRITVVLVVFSILIGIYLWYQGRRDKKAGAYALILSCAVSILWMFLLYLNG